MSDNPKIAALEHENQLLRELARKHETDRDTADYYERLLTEIGKSIGCGHLDDRLPSCVRESMDLLSRPHPAPTPSVEQMCRNLLIKAVDDDVILLSDESPFPSDLDAGDLTGMANMLAGFIGQQVTACVAAKQRVLAELDERIASAKAEAGKPAPDPCATNADAPSEKTGGAAIADPVREALQIVVDADILPHDAFFAKYPHMLDPHERWIGRAESEDGTSQPPPWIVVAESALATPRPLLLTDEGDVLEVLAKAPWPANSFYTTFAGEYAKKIAAAARTIAQERGIGKNTTKDFGKVIDKWLKGDPKLAAEVAKEMEAIAQPTTEGVTSAVCIEPMTKQEAEGIAATMRKEREEYRAELKKDREAFYKALGDIERCAIVAKSSRVWPRLDPFDLVRAQAGEPVCLADGTARKILVDADRGEVLVWDDAPAKPSVYGMWYPFDKNGNGPLGVKLYMANKKESEAS